MDNQSSIDLILDHYENPRNRGVIDNPDLDAQRTNPGCGDVIRVMARLNPDGHIEAIRWEGQGCTISRASASIFTEMVEGKPLSDAVAVDHEQMVDLIGRDILMHRVTCATLALDALRDAAHQMSPSGGSAQESADR
jgi:nitrogen fixation NifU-like protein